MGTWGPGNFDSDTAADHLSSIAGRLLDEVKNAMAGDPVELEPDEYWGVAVPCNLELLTLLSKQRWVGVMLPDVETVREWKTGFLAAYDGSDVGGSPARRAVIAATFERLAAELEQREKRALKQAEPSKPTTAKTKTTRTAKSTRSARPAKAAKPVKPTKSAKRAKPAKTAKTAKTRAR